MNRGKKQAIFIWALVICTPLVMWAAFPLFARTHAEPIYRQFTREVKEAQALGIPLTPADLNPKPTIPDSQNAAPILQKIFATSKEQRAERERIILELNSGKPPHEITLTPDVEAALDAITAIRSKSGINFKRDHTKGLGLLFPELGEMKQLTKLVCRRAALLARLGEAKLAISNLTTALHLTKINRAEKSMIDVLTNLAMEALIMEAYLDVAEAFRGKEDLLTELKKSFDPPEIPNLRDIIVFETGVAFNAIREDAKRQLLEPEAEMPIHHTSAATKILRHGRRCLNLVDQGFPDPHFTGLALDAEEYEIGRFVFTGTDMTIEVLIPEYEALGAALMRTEARHSIVRASFDVLIYESGRGKLPKSLNELGDNFHDPFAVKPIGYRVTENGFRLWSVGQDRVDDGGRSEEEILLAPDSPEPSGDIVEEFPRPKKTGATDR